MYGSDAVLNTMNGLLFTKTASLFRSFVPSTDDIKKINDAKIWNNKDRNRPSFYCLSITKDVISN